MKKLNPEDVTQEAIHVLEIKQAEQAKSLKEEFHTTFETLKPVNIVKNIIHNTVTSPRFKQNLINKTVDVALVLLTNRILKTRTNSVMKRTIGTALVFGIKNVIFRNPQIIKKAGTGIIGIISNLITKRNRNKDYTYSSHI